MTSKPVSFKALSHWRTLLYTSEVQCRCCAEGLLLLFLACSIGLMEHCILSSVLAEVQEKQLSVSSVLCKISDQS